jgi:NAD(P)-dependent dehydrogenase (short-subunit alcohol dehydrogenase family)
MAGEFEGKVVVVSGGAGNLGRAVARRFAEAGAKLVLLDHSAERLQTVAQELGGDMMTEALDLNDAAAVDGLIGRIEARFGQIDVLAHTVGGFASGKPIHENPYDVMEKMINLNVRPIYVFVGRVAKHMVEKGVSGRIVVVLAKAALKGAANQGAYTASKAAAQRLVESMALELRDKNIMVNGVAPSIIDTPPNRQDMPNADFSKWVTPDDLANAIAFLASPATRSITGTTLEVYGRV